MEEFNAFPHLPAGWESTRATLQAYARALGAIPRRHTPHHPRWWHASLKLDDNGLRTDEIPLPDGRKLIGRLDLDTHVITLETDGARVNLDMTDGLTGTEMADALTAAAAEFGLGGGYDRTKFENDDARNYDVDHAAVFWNALESVASVFETRRAFLGARVSPVQVWPHGFDLSFEWFGTKVERHEEGGAVSEMPAQLNLGFYPAGDAYFYSNPWPFEPALVSSPLPHGAQWHTEDWQGSMLPYDLLAGDAHGPLKLMEYAATVFEVAAPTLSM